MSEFGFAFIKKVCVQKHNTVKRRADELALDIKNRLIHKLKYSVFFEIQCDDLTDVAHY